MTLALLLVMACNPRDCEYKIECDTCFTRQDAIATCPVDTGGEADAYVKECDDGVVRVSCGGGSGYGGTEWYFDEEGLYLCRVDYIDDGSYCGGYERTYGDCHTASVACF